MLLHSSTTSLSLHNHTRRTTTLHQRTTKIFSRKHIFCKAHEFSVVPSVIGCVAAFAAGFPFDTYKIRCQTDANIDKHRGLFVGFVPGAALCGLYAFVYFASYQHLVNMMPTSQSASIAATLTLLLKVPSKVVIKIMQRHNEPDITKIAKLIYERNGFFGFFRGFLLYVFNDVPENVIKYNLYDVFHNIHPPLDASWIGLLVGFMTSVLIQPIDVLLNIVMSNIDGNAINFKKINYMRGLFLSILTNTLQCGVFYHVFRWSVKFTTIGAMT
jgi:hypothetical protein